jgi:predicted alpha/beta-hydrolase family hydrolase
MTADSLTADSSPSPELLCNGPETAGATLVLAHGAGAAMDSPFMQAIAEGLSERGWRVLRFEFPYMARSRLSGKRHGPDRQPVLLDSWRQQVLAQVGAGPLLIGGKSMGGRMASLLADELAATAHVLGCICLGYPFHPPGKPQQLRIEHLQQIHTPCLILQGERDTFGRRDEVESYQLSPAVQLAWIADGDHSFKPTKRSGFEEASNLEAAVGRCDQFIRACVSGCGTT